MDKDNDDDSQTKIHIQVLVAKSVSGSDSGTWVAFALGSSMDGAEAMFGLINADHSSNGVVRKSLQGYGYADIFVPLTPLETSSATVMVNDEGMYMLAFTRLLTRSPSFGRHDDISRNKEVQTPVMCASGRTRAGNAMSKHTSRSIVRLNVLKGTVVNGDGSGMAGGATNTGLHTLHAIVMTLTWLVAAPTAIALVRYYRHSPNWLYAHRILAQTTVVGASSGLFTLVTSKRTMAELVVFPHAILGFSMMALCLVQSALGVFTGWKLKQGSGVDHRMLDTTRQMHRYLGRVLASCGFVQCWTGAELLFGTDQSVVLKVWEGVVVLLFAWHEIEKHCFDTTMVTANVNEIRESLHRACTEMRCPTYTLEEFHRKCINGNAWVIVADTVIDVQSWLNVHPGGAAVLRHSIGTDITAKMIGEKSAGSGGGGGRLHRHSGAALRLLHEQVCGRLVGRKEQQDQLGARGLRPRKAAPARVVKRKNMMDALAHDFRRHEIRTMVLVTKERLTSDDVAPVVLYAFDTNEPIVPSSSGGAENAGGAEKNDRHSLCGAHYKIFGTTLAGVSIQRSYTPVDIPRHMCSDVAGGNDGLANTDSSSVAVADHQTKRQVQFCIRLYPNGCMSKILRQARVGDEIRISGPHFSPTSMPLRRALQFGNGSSAAAAGVVGESLGKMKHIGFFVAGTGITPLLQILNAVFLDNHNSSNDGNSTEHGCSLHVVWQCRRPEETFAVQLLAKHLENQLSIKAMAPSRRLHLHFCFTKIKRPESQIRRPALAVVGVVNCCARCWSTDSMRRMRTLDAPPPSKHLTGWSNSAVLGGQVETRANHSAYAVGGEEEGKEGSRELSTQRNTFLSPELEEFSNFSMATTILQGRPNADDLRMYFKPLLEGESKNGRSGLIVICGPPGFASFGENMLTEDLDCPSSMVCRLD